MSEDVRKPLAGIRVLDMTNVLAGPFCCHHLAHLGADVIKVEAVGRGDLSRRLGADPALNERGMGVSFLAQNAGKKSVTINLKHARGTELLHRLVRSADILVENFRPGVMDRLGIGYEALKAVRPELIYCAISGFGQSGQWVDRPAYDQIIQGVSGVMSITGNADSGPLRVGYPIADTVGGLTAAFAVTSALNARPRGAFIDVSMLESVLATLGWVVSNYLIAGVEPAANGNENPTSAPSGAFQAADGLINIAANKDEQWLSLIEFLGLGGLAERPEYATREERKRNRSQLRDDLNAVLSTRPAREWARELNAIGVPAGAVMTVPEVLDTEQISGRGFLNTFANVPGVDRDITVVTTGIRVDGSTQTVDAPPPRLGEHTEEVWSQLGLSAQDIEALRKEGTI